MPQNRTGQSLPHPHLFMHMLDSPAWAGGFRAVFGGGVGGVSFFVIGGRGGMAGATSGPGGWGAARIWATGGQERKEKGVNKE